MTALVGRWIIAKRWNNMRVGSRKREPLPSNYSGF